MGGTNFPYIYIYMCVEYFEKSSCKKPLNGLKYIFAEITHRWASTGIVQTDVIRHKQGTGLIFPIYIYGKHWNYFNIIQKKYSFSDP